MSTLNIQLLYRRSKRFPLIIYHLLPDLAPWLILNGSNYPYLEQIFMVPKRFEPFRFDCILFSIANQNMNAKRFRKRWKCQNSIPILLESFGLRTYRCFLPQSVHHHRKIIKSHLNYCDETNTRFMKTNNVDTDSQCKQKPQVELNLLTPVFNLHQESMPI